MSWEANDAVKELMQAFHRFHRREMEASSDSRRTEARALILLSDHGDNGLKVSELSKLMRVSSPFVTQLVNQLEARNLVVRRQDSRDGRIVRIVPSPAGLAEAQEIKRNFYLRFTELTEHMGEGEARTLTRLLNKAFDYIEHKKSMSGRTEESGPHPSVRVEDTEE